MNSIFHNYGFKLCLDQVRDRSKSKNMINCYKIKLMSIKPVKLNSLMSPTKLTPEQDAKSSVALALG